MFDLKTKILVIDDVLMMRRLVIKSCQEIGFSEFLEASDGKMAWDLLSIPGQDIGLVISDITMPSMTGIDLLKKVRSDRRWVQLPFLMITAESEKSMILDAIQAGVSNYLVKPFTTATLRQKLEAIYERAPLKK